MLLELECVLLFYPMYSSHIAPSGYYIFKSLQDALHDTYFQNYEVIKSFIDEWIALKDKSFFIYGIHLFPER